MAEETVAQGKLSKVKDAKSKKGKDYIQATIGGWSYSIFKPAEFPQFYDNEGKMVEIRYTMSDDEQYRNYVDGSLKALANGTSQGDQMPKEYWEQKQRFDRRLELVRALIAAGRKGDTPGVGEFEIWDRAIHSELPLAKQPETRGSAEQPQLPADIDTSDIQNAQDFHQRCKKYGIEFGEVLKMSKLTPTEFGKLPPERLTSIWLGAVTAKKQAEG